MIGYFYLLAVALLVFGAGVWTGHRWGSDEAGVMYRYGYDLGISSAARNMRAARKAITVLIHRRRSGRVAR